MSLKNKNYKHRPYDYEEAFFVLHQLYIGYGELVSSKRKVVNTKKLNQFLDSNKVILNLFREIEDDHPSKEIN